MSNALVMVVLLSTVNSGSSKPSIGSDLLPEMHMTFGFQRNRKSNS